MTKALESGTLVNGKPLNRMNDIFAKFIFANEARKGLTLDLINSVFEFEGAKEIVDFEFRDREFDPETEEGKGVVLDVTGRSSDGVLVNVEIQLHKLAGMEKRMLYYWSLLYGRRLAKGEEYATLNRTVVISILAYHLFDREVWPHFHSSFAVLNTKALQHRLTEDLEIHFVELPKWRKKAVKEMTRMERWMAYLSPATTEEERRQLIMIDTAIATAAEAEKAFLECPEYLTAYERREKNLRDLAAMKTSAREDGHAEGLAAGLAEGRAEGLAEGRAEGLAEGRAEGLAEGRAEGLAEGRLAEQKSLILKWHREGKSNAVIAELLGKTEDEVAAVLQDV